MLQISWSWLWVCSFPVFLLTWLSSFNTAVSQPILPTDRISATQCIAQVFAIVRLHEQMKRDLFSHGYSLNSIASQEHKKKTMLTTNTETLCHARWLVMLKCVRSYSWTTMFFCILVAFDLRWSSHGINIQVDNLLSTWILLPLLADSFKIIDISSSSWRKAIQAIAILIPLSRRCRSYKR
jgi:hypothetical protein